ncbi:MAG: MoaD/ThiS family protein [Gammaproteobacteria bacterium]
MKLRLLFFGRLRERLQSDGEILEWSAPTASLCSIRQKLIARGGVWAEELAEDKALGFAINQRFAQLNDEVADDAEIAIFPPVTGG